jgi:SnoaL-like protein
MTEADILGRIDRIESQLAIQQLPIRYALAVDGRDLDAWLALFVEDVDCGRHGRGRDALHALIEPQLRTFYRSVHQICGHEVKLLGPDTAQGTVYCRAEHEVGDQWVVMAIAYFDEYARRDGLWYFVRRQEKHWYSVDVLERPGTPFHRWPADGAAARLPRDFPTWLSFWNSSSESGVAAISRDPVKGSP